MAYVIDRTDRRGQPIKMPSKKRGLNYSVYLDEDQINALEEIKWRERKSKSEIIRIAIEEYINNHLEGNNAFTLDKWQEDPNFRAVPTLLSDAEKWNKYIDECNDEECTKIAVMASHVNKVVQMRRTKEWKEQQQQQQKR